MSVQDIYNNLQTIGNQGIYQVAPKLPTPKPVQTPNPLSLMLTKSSNSKTSTPLDQLAKLMGAIKGQESGGNYKATNASGASGAYQILRSNFENAGGWDKNALGYDISYNQFINSPQLQDAIARYELGSYLKKYGLSGAIAAWYGGPGAVSKINSTTPQGAYPSINAYVQQVLARM